MKRLFNTLALAAALWMGTGCQNMLDLDPHHAVSPESVNAKDIEALRRGMYKCVQEKPKRESYIMFDLMGGNLTTKASTNSIELINSLSSAESAIVEAQWQGYYNALMQTNNVFAIAQTLPAGATRDKVIGECHYFRAYLHMCLVTRFGDVPLMEYNTDELVYRTPAAQVWGFISDELDRAIALLGSSDSYYYLSKDAATALKARVALYRGNKTAAWQLSESLIANARYGMDEFSKMFRGSINSPEIIFSFPCLTSDNSAIAISTLFYSYNHPNSGSYVYRPAPDVMSGLYSDADTRKGVSITTLDNLDFINKYPSGQVGTDPVVISRLAEMYLISAEAQGLEKGLPRLNELRERRGLAKVYPATEARFIEAVLEERRRELLCENHRWYDLVRTGKAVEMLGIQGFQTLMPIPASERAVNKNLSQNDGY